MYSIVTEDIEIVDVITEPESTEEDIKLVLQQIDDTGQEIFVLDGFEQTALTQLEENGGLSAFSQQVVRSSLESLMLSHGVALKTTTLKAYPSTTFRAKQTELVIESIRDTIKNALTKLIEFLKRIGKFILDVITLRIFKKKKTQEKIEKIEEKIQEKERDVKKLPAPAAKTVEEISITPHQFNTLVTHSSKRVEAKNLEGEISERVKILKEVADAAEQYIKGWVNVASNLTADAAGHARDAEHSDAYKPILMNTVKAGVKLHYSSGKFDYVSPYGDASKLGVINYGEFSKPDKLSIPVFSLQLCTVLMNRLRSAEGDVTKFIEKLTDLSNLLDKTVDDAERLLKTDAKNDRAVANLRQAVSHVGQFIAKVANPVLEEMDEHARAVMSLVEQSIPHAQ